MKKATILTGILLSGTLFVTAQEEKKEIPKKEKKESITINVDGDKVTINGKPAEEYKGDVDIRVNKNGWKGKDRIVKGYFKPNGLENMEGLFDKNFNWNTPSNRAVLGVVTADDEKGAKIKDISRESAAEKAGLQVGDIITKIGNKNIDGPDDLYDAIGKYEPNEKVAITFLRNEKEQTVTAALGKQNSGRRIIEMNDNAFDFDFSDLKGLERLKDLGNIKVVEGHPLSSRPKLGIKIEDLEEGDGVKVLNVEENSAAAKAGIQKNDIITQFNDEKVKDLDKLRNELSGMRQGDSFKLGYKRNGKSMEATVKYPKKLKKADL